MFSIEDFDENINSACFENEIGNNLFMSQSVDKYGEERLPEYGNGEKNEAVEIDNENVHKKYVNIQRKTVVNGNNTLISDETSIYEIDGECLKRKI